jgi:hypothetical protein
MGIIGKNHLDIAYAFRNVVVHAGGCDVATNQRDIDTCNAYSGMLASIVPDLTSDISFMIYQYTARLQHSRLPATGRADPISLGDTLEVTVQALNQPPQVEIIPGTSARTRPTSE